MAQRETNNGSGGKDLDKFGQMKAALKERNKTVCDKYIGFLQEDEHSELSFDSDIGTEHFKKSTELEQNKEIIKNLKTKAESLKSFSLLQVKYNEEMDYLHDERAECDELLQTYLDVQNQNSIIFRKIQKIQIDFNKCFQEFNETLEDKSNVKNVLDKHEKLVERTCMIENGINKLFHCNKDFLKKKYKKNMKEENKEEFNKMSNDLAQGLLSSIYKKAAKNVKNHPHLLDIKNSNKLFFKNKTVDSASSTALDPPTE